MRPFSDLLIGELRGDAEELNRIKPLVAGQLQMRGARREEDLMPVSNQFPGDNHRSRHVRERHAVSHDQNLLTHGQMIERYEGAIGGRARESNSPGTALA